MHQYEKNTQCFYTPYKIYTELTQVGGNRKPDISVVKIIDPLTEPYKQSQTRKKMERTPDTHYQKVI